MSGINSQLLRVIIAGILATVTTIATVGLALAGVEIPEDLGVITVACLTFLFGVVTNGSGLGLPPDKK